MMVEVIHECFTNKVRFTAENEEERKLLGDCTFYDASDEEINQARIAYFNPRSSEKVAERYGTGPSLFTNEELEMLFDSH